MLLRLFRSCFQTSPVCLKYISVRILCRFRQVIVARPLPLSAVVSGRSLSCATHPHRAPVSNALFQPIPISLFWSHLCLLPQPTLFPLRLWVAAQNSPCFLISFPRRAGGCTTRLSSSARAMRDAHLLWDSIPSSSWCLQCPRCLCYWWTSPLRPPWKLPTSTWLGSSLLAPSLLFPAVGPTFLSGGGSPLPELPAPALCFWGSVNTGNHVGPGK